MKGKRKSKFPARPSTMEVGQITNGKITRISNQNYLYVAVDVLMPDGKQKMGNKNVLNAFGKWANSQDISAED